jgi:hypothetical protein
MSVFAVILSFGLGDALLLRLGIRMRGVRPCDVEEKFTTHDRLWLDLDRGLALRKREWTSTPGSQSLYLVNLLNRGNGGP